MSQSTQAPRTAAERDAVRRATLQQALDLQQRARRRRRGALLGSLGGALVLLTGGGAWSVLGGRHTAPSFCGGIAPGHPNGRRWSTAPPLTIDASAAYRAVLATSCGDIAITLDAKAAPHTVNSFAFLAQQHYFDHTRCHRLTTSGIFVLQCGDPTGSGTGSPGYGFADENLGDPRIRGGHYPAGIVAMSNTGRPDSNGSQFFIVYRTSALPPEFTPFGSVASGLATVRRVAADGSDNSHGDGDGRPRDTVAINSVEVAKG